MDKRSNIVELLAPAGNFEKLETAVHFGADAVYLAGKDFSLRNFSGNFTVDELEAAVRFCHQRDVKIYLACNIYSRNAEQKVLAEYLRRVGRIDIDAIILSDPGVFMMVKRTIPHVPIHLSTQANTTNLNSVLFWESQGIARVNVARELSLEEIAEIAAHSSVEVEAFVHGAMCIAYSGRCLLSSFLAHRESNRGMCTHSCRWKYALVEETRPGRYMPVAEDARGSYILNSRDLCMVSHLPRMIEAGVSSLKIEGRMKSIHYVGATVKVYREALDHYYKDPENYRVKTDWLDELAAVGPRGYCTGFYLGDTDQKSPNFDNVAAAAPHRFVGKVLCVEGTDRIVVDVRNKIEKGDTVSILSRSGSPQRDTILDIRTEHDVPVLYAQPGGIAVIRIDTPCRPNDLIRAVS